MTLDPQTITPLNQLTETDVGTICTLHGVLDTSGDEPRLVEVPEDYSGDRLPVTLALQGFADAADHAGAYVVVAGVVTVQGDRPAFGVTGVEVEDYDAFDPELADHTSVTSRTEAYDILSEILGEYSDPLPERYVIETAIERGVTRETTRDVLTRMADAGNIYSPESGIIGGM